MIRTSDTPVLFLVFNRPNTTRTVFEQIKRASPKQLFIAQDGPRPQTPGEKEKCHEVRSIVSNIDWPCEVQTLYREENLGCGPAVSSAITWFFEQVKEGIILEDDCLPDLSFFSYCEELLKKYRDTDQVKLISGNNFQGGKTRGTGSYYFSHYPEIWGWATWRRVWQEYNFEIKDLSKESLARVYTSAKEQNYWYEKFQLTAEGKTNTWDYQLTYSIVKNNGLAISPQVNLVKNIGLENNATHASLKDSYKILDLHEMQFPLKHPEIIADGLADKSSFQRIYGHSIGRLLRLIKENGIINFIKYYLRQR